jgi:hypothetical protein
MTQNAFGDKATQQIGQTVREHYRRLRNSASHRGTYWQEQRNVQCKLMEDLLAAVDTFNDPSFATAKVIIRNSSGDMELTQNTITIVNRFENISVEAGTYCKAEWIDGEWQLYAADCPGTLSASSFAPSVSISPSVSTGGP